MDMTDVIPNAKGFSPTNLRYMMRFYALFKDIEIVPQLGEQLDYPSVHLLVLFHYIPGESQ